MHTGKDPMKQLVWSRLAVTAMLAVGVVSPPLALAQTPPRFYQDTLSGSSAVPLIFQSTSGNISPFDAAHTVTQDANFDATMATVGYARTFSFYDRAAMAAILLPMGRISGDLNVDGKSVSQSASGFGDPMLEFSINVIGPPAQKNIPDVLRYEPGFSMHLLADLGLPIGEYDSDQLVNVGQNQWFGRLGAPMTWQIGPWVPGRRMTLEFLPAVWLFDDNTDYVGQTLKTDPLFKLDASLTRDFTQRLWGSLDAIWLNGGAATINGVKGEKLDSVALGLTLGYFINENLNLTLGYKSTINDSDPGDLSQDQFMATLVFGWHPLVEGMRRLTESE